MGLHRQKGEQCRPQWWQGYTRILLLRQALDSMAPTQAGTGRKLHVACPRSMLWGALWRCQKEDCLWSSPTLPLAHLCQIGKHTKIRESIGLSIKEHKGCVWIMVCGELVGGERGYGKDKVYFLGFSNDFDSLRLYFDLKHRQGNREAEGSNSSQWLDPSTFPFTLTKNWSKHSLCKFLHKSKIQTEPKQTLEIKSSSQGIYLA